MSLVEAVLTYRPHGTGGATPIPLGATDDPQVLRALRDRLLEQASAEADVWRSIDPGVAAMQVAESKRLAQILAFLLPEEDRRDGLRLVGDRREDEQA